MSRCVIRKSRTALPSGLNDANAVPAYGSRVGLFSRSNLAAAAASDGGVGVRRSGSGSCFAGTEEIFGR